MFHNSDYPKDSKFFDSTNKKVIGKFKDEAAVMPIREFVGLRSKMYSYVKDNGKNEKTAKGVRKYVIKKNITHDNYKDCLLNGKQMLHSMRTIRSDHHQIGSYLLNKISLSCFDDKRYIHEDGIQVEYKIIPLTRSKNTLKYYENWWERVHSLIKADISGLVSHNLDQRCLPFDRKIRLGCRKHNGKRFASLP